MTSVTLSNSAQDHSLQENARGALEQSSSTSDDNNNLTKHRASQKEKQLQNTGGDPDSLHSIGSLMDYDDDEENQGENQQRPRQLSSSSAALSSSSSSAAVPVNKHKHQQQQQQTKKPAPLGDATTKQILQPRSSTITKNTPNNSPFMPIATGVIATTTNNAMCQHRHRLLAGGQVAASLLTPTMTTTTTTATTAAAAAAAVATEVPTWDGLVRKGTKLKSFLDGALQHAGYAVTNYSGGGAGNTTSSNKRQRLLEEEGECAVETQNHHQDILEREQAAALLAKDKTKAVLLLQQQLEETKTQIAALKASNDTLRNESTTSSLRFERTIEALKISAANATCARTDADQAEASAEGMAAQLEALKTVVEQTKAAAQVMHSEQEEIVEQSQKGQAMLLQVEADLARSKKENEDLRKQSTEWKTQINEMQQEFQELKQELANEKEQARKLTKVLEERDALEEARQKRSQQLEQELKQAQELLLEASSKAASDETLATLHENLKELQKANHKLHEQLAQQEETVRQETDRLKQALETAEEEAKQLRIEVKLNQDMQGKQTSNDRDASVDPNDCPFTISTTLNMSNTTEATVRNEDTHAVPPAVTCSICFKKAFGIMKSCQCGQPDCSKRAHLTCVKSINPGPSVSHPGTPAAKLPTILCSEYLQGIIAQQQAKLK